MEVFRYSLGAVLPMVLQILLGYLFQRWRLLSDGFFAEGKKLAFKVLVPVTIFLNIYNSSSIRNLSFSTALFSFVWLLLLFLVGLAAGALFPDRRKKSVVGQAAYRSNFSVISIPLSQALGGSGGAALAGLLSAIVIPEINILATVNLTLAGSEPSKGISVKKLLSSIFKNPMVISALLGVACLLLRDLIPVNAEGKPVFSISGNLPSLFSAVSSLGRASSPFTLVILGGSLKISKFTSNRRDLFIGTVLRLIVAPVLVIGSAVLLCRAGLLHFGIAEYTCLVSIFASPLAVATGVMTANMGGDGEYADQLVVMTTVFSALTVFLIVFVMRSAQLL